MTARGVAPSDPGERFPHPQFEALPLPEPGPSAVRVCTTCSLPSLSVGDIVDLPSPDCPWTSIRSTVIAWIRKRHSVSCGSCIFFSSDGHNIPDNGSPAAFPRTLYVIVSEPLYVPRDPDDPIENIVDCSRSSMTELLSPTGAGSQAAFCEFASFLGYLAHSGADSPLILSALSAFFGIAPLHAIVDRLASGRSIVARDVFALSAFFATILIGLGAPDDDSLFEHTLDYMRRLASLRLRPGLPRLRLESLPADPGAGFLDVAHVLDLRRAHHVSLFRGVSGPWLYLSRRQDKLVCRMRIADPESGAVREANVEELAREVGDFECQAPAAVVQLVFVVFDESSSMADPFAAGLNRFDAVRKILKTFVRSACACDAGTLFGLISFANRVTVRSELTPLAITFEDAMNRIEPNGPTRCFGAMQIAAEKLVEAQAHYPNTILRIFLISDGLDNRTPVDEIQILPGFLIDKKIRVDSMIVSDEVEPRLCVVTKWTGGLVFKPNSVADGIKIVESEAFFNVSLRKFGLFQRLPIAADWVANYPQFTARDAATDIPFVGADSADAGSVVLISAHRLIAKQSPDSARAPRQQRIFEELDTIVRNNNPEFVVYVVRNRPDTWWIVMRGPDGSPYAKKWWHLTLEFMRDYPKSPPMVRFAPKTIYHANVRIEGRVSIPALDADYRPDVRIADLLAQLERVFISPDYEHPVDKHHQNVLLDRDLYRAKVDKSVQDNMKFSVGDWTKDWVIDDT
jgi:ubiquitin-conjugating enzyme E2 B